MRSSVTVLSDTKYRIMSSPDALYDCEGDRCCALIDHDDQIIWIDPVISESGRAEVIERAVAQARRDVTRSS